MSKFARRCAALMLAVVLLCMAVPAAFAAEGDTLPAGATTMGGANTTLIPDEEENYTTCDDTSCTADRAS